MRRPFLLACAVCLALRVADGRVSADPTPETPICGLDGFELDTLDQAAKWDMTLEPVNCIVPTGYEETNITTCQVYFSICKPVDQSVCQGHTNSSTCQVVTTNDNHHHFYSIGDFQNVNEFQVVGGPDSVGFSTLRRGDTIQSRLCNGSYSTSLTWACDGLHHWNPQSPDATSFITSVVGRSIDDCFLEVEFGYTGACYETPTASPAHCQLDPYDMVELSSNDYWFATVDPVLCYGDEATDCTIYFSFCRTVPPDVDGACYEAGVCQVGTDGDGNKFGYNMGKFNPQFTQFYENVDEKVVGFHLDVVNGSQPDDGRCNANHGIRTRIILACNSSVKWSTNDLTGLIQVAYLEDLEPCEYVIMVPYAGACQPPICGLDGFELDTLDQAANWDMTLEPVNCIVPTGYKETNITACQVYFSICKPVDQSVCLGHTNSSTCQVVTTNDNHRHFYSIGDFQNANEFQVVGGPDSVGFTTLRRGDTIESRLCNGSYSTSLTWACDELYHWNPQSPDATPFITNIIGRSIDSCFLEVEFGYTGACYETPTASPAHCQLDPYDTVELLSNDYWFATVDPVLCYGNEATHCTLYFSFCRTVPPDVDGACYEAGVCQVSIDGDGNKFGYNMGKFNPQLTQFYENVDEKVVGFHLDVTNGSQPDDGRCNTNHGIKTRIILACNSSVKWSTNDLTGLIQVAYLEDLFPCSYVIMVPYAGACRPPNNPVVEAVVKYIGWIFIGLFLFVVVVYLAVGASFQFFIRNERGIKVIPNYEFWAFFVMSVLEGCKFSFNAITCFQFEDKIKSLFSGPGRSAINYDKIIIHDRK